MMEKAVLLIEEFEDSRELLKIMLEMLGQRLIVVSDDEVVIRITEATNFDFVFVDI